METLLLKTKRKKRKTRKCLDELRKKSRNSFTNLVSLSTNLEKKQERCLDIIKPIHIAASNFKCNILKKVVRSETVTRSVLPKHKLCDNNKYDNMKSAIQNTSDNDILHPVTVCYTNNDGNRLSLDNNFNDPDGGNSSDSQSLILFSHFNDELSSHEEETKAPRQSVENNGYHLYEEFMDSLPNFIQTNFNNLIKNDNIVEETKEALQNLSINYPPNKLRNKMYLLDKMSSGGIEETVVQNPMDYIRFGSMLQGNIYKCKEHLSNEDTSSMTEYSYEHSPCVQNFQSILSKTPEYNYFPHKLN